MQGTIFQEVLCGHAKIVDVSERSMSIFDRVNAALDLGKCDDKTLPFEEIKDKVKLVVDQKRKKDCVTTGAQETRAKIFTEAFGMKRDGDEDGTEIDNGNSVFINDKKEPEKISK